VYDVVQILVKTILIAATLLVAAIVCIRVWKSDLDVRQLLSPTRLVQRAVSSQIDWLPKPEMDAIYQDGKIVARVAGARYDDTKGKIYFEEISNSRALDLSREFEYQKWQLKFVGAEALIGMLASAPEKGQIIQKVVCDVLGERKPI
jgi:hypothetical protein